MTEAELRSAREAVRRGEITESLERELAAIVRWLVFAANLPASISPYGAWDDEAARELLQAWTEEKLLRGGLPQLLERARTPDAFRRLARRSLRHWVLNQRRRSQSQNLYARLRELLAEPSFAMRQDAGRPQDVWWTLASSLDAPLYAGTETQLLSIAWGLGDFELLRYSERNKLSPLLSAKDIQQFVEGLMRESGSALRLSDLMATMRGRFGLDDVVVEELDPEALPLASEDALADEVALRTLAEAVINELTERQRDVLLGTRAQERLEDMAARHGCAIATIHNEQRRIGAAVERLSENRDERDALLKTAGDLLYERNE